MFAAQLFSPLNEVLTIGFLLSAVASPKFTAQFLSAEWFRLGGISGGTDFPAQPDRG